MDIFIARQPILTKHRRLYAYELLYRGTKKTTLKTAGGNRATTSVLSSAFLTEGISRISGSRPCFINFTRDLLLQNIPASFPTSLLVVEVLEDVPPTPDVVEICQNLKKAGYSIALDDFIYDKTLDPLIRIADIIKFDIRISSIDTIQKTLHRLAIYKLKYLAEKVESYDEFIQMSKLGFTYFQGYFFCKPEKIRITELDSSKINMVAMMAEITKKTTSSKKLEKIIQKDVGLSYKLLRFINSSYFYRLNKIESIAHAITYLGEKELRRFLILVLVSELSTDKPGELVRLAIVRAKMCELLVSETALRDKNDELFLLGLFSLLDAMLDSTLEDVCKRLSLSDTLEKALVRNSGPYAPYLRVVINYEKRNKAKCLTALKEIGIRPEGVRQMYLEAISFAESVMV